MASLLGRTLTEVLKAVAPLIGFACLLQFTLINAPLALFLQFLIGAVFATAGMYLLFLGIDLGILPMGRFIGAELPQRGSFALILAVTFSFAFATTVAEPDVLVLAQQVDQLSSGGISRHLVLYAMAAGVGAFASLAIARMVLGWSMRVLIIGIYLLILALSFFAINQFVPLAYDSGSVTTGVVTAPVVIALTTGLSSVLAGRSSVSDGFGILGIASAGAIVTMLMIGLF